MQTYTKQAAEKIIACRAQEFDVRDDGIWPKGIESNCEEITALEWKPCCELDRQDAPDPLATPSLPTPFTSRQLAAFFVHGQGWYVRDSFGAWEDGPDSMALDMMGILASKAKEAVKGAFAAYREAERVVGTFDNALAVQAQALEREYCDSISTTTTEQWASLREAQKQANESESVWRKKMVNQLLVVEQVPLVPTAEPARDGPAPLTTAPAWSLKRPKRFQGYGKPLYDFLKYAHIAVQPRPNARDLLDAWKTNQPSDVAEVSDNGLKYYDAKGNTKPADLDAIRKAIGRMTQ